jgi:hypothetical protein
MKYLGKSVCGGSVLFIETEDDLNKKKSMECIFVSKYIDLSSLLIMYTTKSPPIAPVEGVNCWINLAYCESYDESTSLIPTSVIKQEDFKKKKINDFPDDLKKMIIRIERI